MGVYLCVVVFCLSIWVEAGIRTSFSITLHLFFIWSRALHWIQSAPLCITWQTSKPLVFTSLHLPNTGVIVVHCCVRCSKWVLMIWIQVLMLKQLVFYSLNPLPSPSLFFSFNQVSPEMVHASQWNKPWHLRVVRHFTCLSNLSTKISRKSEVGDGD